MPSNVGGLFAGVFAVSRLSGYGACNAFLKAVRSVSRVITMPTFFRSVEVSTTVGALLLASFGLTVILTRGGL